MLRPTNHKISRLQERKAAATYGGKVTPGSGNQWFKKADVQTSQMIIECKATMKNSYTIKADDLAKLNTQAVLEDKLPVFEIQFTDRNVTYVVIEQDEFLNLAKNIWF